MSEKRVYIVVLGDIGRSPRMQYHALSFLAEGFTVTLVGYGGSAPQHQLLSHRCVSLHYMLEPPRCIFALPRLLTYGVKVIWQTLTLLAALMFCRRPSHILLQNPPALPTLAVCWFVSLLRGCIFIVDWHNYAYSILGLSLGSRHPLVKFSKRYEKFFGRFAHKNICVTNAMKADLHDNWNVEAVTMYDRPPPMFKPSTVEEQHKLFMQLSADYPKLGGSEASGARTAFTELCENGEVKRRDDRPLLLVSSTSWTEDEDFSLLLNALQCYEEAATNKSLPGLPELVCVITGKGPLKQFYCHEIAQRAWSHVTVITPWLEPNDYPLLIGCADLGVCLHLSSSGLDLPMKVVDMFGCGVPVCAVNFSCLDELIQDGENGLVFESHQQLAKQFQDLLRGFPNKCHQLEKFRKNLQQFQNTRWDDSWKSTVLPLLNRT